MSPSSEYKVPFTDPPVTLQIGDPRETARRPTDVFVVLIEGLAQLAEHNLTDPFPQLMETFAYQGILLSILATSRPAPAYKTVVASVRGLGEYMSIAQSIGKRNCRVFVRGTQVALMTIDNSYSAGASGSTDFAPFAKTGPSTADNPAAKI